MMKVRLTIVSLLLAAATAAFAAEQSPLRQLDYFKGTWTCKGMAFAMPDAPEHAVAGKITDKWIMNGAWLQFNYDGMKTKADPKPMAAYGFMGWDAEKKNFAMGGVCSDGCYSTESSPGWENDVMIFTGPNHMGGMTVTGRDEFHKISASELKYVYQVEMNGKWQKAMEETCKKSK
jgi:hypothetical protein